MLHMDPLEKHALRALEDSDIMVIKVSKEEIMHSAF